MHNRLQRVPTKMIKCRNSKTTEPHQFLDTADQSCLTPALLHWKQRCFSSVKPEGEKGNLTHPDSPYFHSVLGTQWPKLPNIWVLSKAICSLGKQMAWCLPQATYQLPLAVTQSKEVGKRLCIYRSSWSFYRVSKPGHLLVRHSSFTINTAIFAEGLTLKAC